MSPKFHFLLLPVLLLVFSSAFAQGPTPKTVSGGIVNEKALTLPEPVYPAAAKAVRATGAVNVQVTIDEEGNVIAASALSGHPLLRAASVAAARQAKFSPTVLSGRPVKVTGVIVYSFFLPLRWRNIGAALGDAETEIEKTDGLEWAAQQLESQYPTESQQIKAIVENFRKDEENSRSQAFAVSEAVNSLVIKLNGRAEELKYFELGLAVGRIKAGYFDDAVLQANLSKIKEFVDSLPEKAADEFAPDSLNALRDLTFFANKTMFTRRDKAKIRELNENVR